MAASKNLGRKVAIVFATLILVIGGVFCIARYGWRLLGFAACRVGPVWIVDAQADGNTVRIHGNTINSADAYVGCLTAVEGDTLYLGLKYNTLIGFWNRDGSFRISVELPDGVDRIALKGQDGERVIWEDGGLVKKS